MKSLLEKLTCRFKINNGTEKIYDEDQERNLALERNQPQEMAQIPGEFCPRRSLSFRHGPVDARCQKFARSRG